MKQLTCEMCGSTNLTKQDGVFVCQSCGTKYSVEDARKMMVEGKVDVSGSTVNIDSTQKLDNLYTLARRAKDARNSEDAARYYNEIRIYDPNSWEATFYAVYFTALQCRVGEAGSAANNITNCLGSTLRLVKENVLDDAKKAQYVSEIANDCISASRPLYAALWNMYDANGYYNNAADFVGHSEPAKLMLRTLADLIDSEFGHSEPYVGIILRLLLEDMEYTISEAQKKYSGITAATFEMKANKIKKYDPTFGFPQSEKSQSSGATQSQSSGGCYVATAVYGSYDCPQVWTLRRFRDYTLAETWYGRAFIHTYYAISPTLVKWFGHTEWFKKMWKGKLDRIVANLNAEGVEDTPYEDKTW